jgi:hypothetical protein
MLTLNGRPTEKLINLILKIKGYESVCIYFCLAKHGLLGGLISLKEKLVDIYIDFKLSNNNTKDNLKDVITREFIEWFVGFTDAEGCFYFTISANERLTLSFRFIIELHVDDVKILEKICKILGVGRVSINGNSARYQVSNIEQILKVIIPIFKEFPLQTTKYLDFVCFEQAINIFASLAKKKSAKGSLTQRDKDTLMRLKESMNTKRLISEKEENFLKNKVLITKWWLLGFTEGEGTFGYKHLVPYFQIAQHKKNLYVLEAIEEFLFKLFKGSALLCFAAKQVKGQSKKLNQKDELKFIYTLNKLTGVYSMSIVKIELNFYYIIPFFESLKFLSRKKIDYDYWVLMVLMHKLGYYYLPEGKKIALQIASSTNKFRYTTNDPASKLDLPSEESISKLFDHKPLFELNSELSYFDQVRKLTIEKGGRKGFTVYIYESLSNHPTQLKEVKGSPFTTYGDGHEALGLRRGSRTIGRYIDTGKKYKEKFIFTSLPLKDN